MSVPASSGLSRRSLLRRALLAPAVLGVSWTVPACGSTAGAVGRGGSGFGGGGGGGTGGGRGTGRSVIADRLAPRGADSGPRIERVDLWPLRYPMTGYFKFFTGPHGAAGRAAVMLRITLEDGTIGWGQSLPIAKWSDETLETVTVALAEYFAPALLGRSIASWADLDRAHAALDAAVAPGFSTGMPIARAGLDLALHDLLGKQRGQNIATLWGRDSATQPLTLSWTVNARSLDEVPELVAAGVERGYRHANIKVGPDATYDVALAREVRRLLPDGFLWADANGGYTPEAALLAAPLLADAGVDVLEAPLRPNRLRGYRDLVRQDALPILMDEGVLSLVDLEEFAALGMLNGLAMKPARCGLLANRRQIDYCRRHELLWLGSGLTDPDVSLAATLCLYGAYGLRRPAALNGPQFLTADLLRTPLRIENSQAWAPTGPGLGVDVDEDALVELAERTARVTES